MFVKYISRTRKAKLLFSLFKLFTIYLPKCNLKQAAPVHYESVGGKSLQKCQFMQICRRIYVLFNTFGVPRR